jgi:ankyrin repeat protein
MLWSILLPLEVDGIVKGISWVASKVFPKSNPYQIRRWELGISTLLGATVIWRSSINRIPAAVVYTAYKAWDLWRFYTVDCQKEKQAIRNFFSTISNCEAGSLATLWERQPYLFKSTNREGKNALHMAIEHKRTTMVVWLISLGLFPALNVCSGDILKPLHLAVQQGDLESVKFLYKQDQGAIKETIPGVGDLFALAAKEDHVEIVRWLVGTNELGEKKASEMFERALQTCDKGTQVIEWIYTDKIKIDQQGFSLGRAVNIALENNNTKVAEWVQRKDPQLGNFLKEDCQQQILSAAQKGYKEILVWVYEVIPEAINTIGSVLLSLAIKNGKQDVAEWLYEKNAQFFTNLGDGILKDHHPTMTNWVHTKFLNRGKFL